MNAVALTWLYAQKQDFKLFCSSHLSLESKILDNVSVSKVYYYSARPLFTGAVTIGKPFNVSQAVEVCLQCPTIFKQDQCQERVTPIERILKNH